MHQSTIRFVHSYNTCEEMIEVHKSVPDLKLQHDESSYTVELRDSTGIQLMEIAIEGYMVGFGFFAVEKENGQENAGAQGEERYC